MPKPKFFGSLRSLYFCNLSRQTHGPLGATKQNMKIAGAIGWLVIMILTGGITTGIGIIMSIGCVGYIVSELMSNSDNSEDSIETNTVERRTFQDNAVRSPIESQSSTTGARQLESDLILESERAINKKPDLPAANKAALSIRLYIRELVSDGKLSKHCSLFKKREYSNDGLPKIDLADLLEAGATVQGSNGPSHYIKPADAYIPTTYLKVDKMPVPILRTKEDGEKLYLYDKYDIATDKTYTTVRPEMIDKRALDFMVVTFPFEGIDDVFPHHAAGWTGNKQVVLAEDTMHAVKARSKGIIGLVNGSLKYEKDSSVSLMAQDTDEIYEMTKEFVHDTAVAILWYFSTSYSDKHNFFLVQDRPEFRVVVEQMVPELIETNS